MFLTGYQIHLLAREQQMVIISSGLLSVRQIEVAMVRHALKNGGEASTANTFLAGQQNGDIMR